MRNFIEYLNVSELGIGLTKQEIILIVLLL